MNKKPSNPSWFSQLFTPGFKGRFEWLRPFAQEVEKIADFGCQSSEPFALLWTLDAAEVVVVEKDAANLIKPREELERLSRQTQESLEGRTVGFLVGDMTADIPNLQSNYFDLAFCENVLYMVDHEKGLQGVQSAINQMRNCIKPGGLVIAIENMMGVEVEEVESFMGILLPVPKTPPKDISSLFEAEQLSRIDLNMDFWVYCYRKPQAD